MTTLLTMAVVLVGGIGYGFLPVPALPQVDFPTIAVSTTLPGASPATMAASIATPLEREFSAVAGHSRSPPEYPARRRRYYD
jgi:HAE1 family hydrophobic/amphiphilic exporter-1/multidrug efflux pump